jgi:microtubule-associated protein-like 1/2
VLKYSPDDKRLAVGSHDNNIYIYDVDGNSYKLKGALKGHNSFITQLDWSRDG